MEGNLPSAPRPLLPCLLWIQCPSPKLSGPCTDRCNTQKPLLTVQSQAELLNVSEPWLPYFENSYNITYQSTVHRVVVKINKKI